MSRIYLMWNFDKPKGKIGDPATKQLADSLEEKYKKHFPFDDDDYVRTNTKDALGGVCSGTEVTQLLQKVLEEHADESQDKPIVAIRYQDNDHFPRDNFAHIIRDGDQVVEVGVEKEFYRKVRKADSIDLSIVSVNSATFKEYEEKYWNEYCDAVYKRLDVLILAELEKKLGWEL